METTFLKPRYDSGGFASLPGHILELLAADRYDAVVFFLIDSFGWRFFDKFQDTPFFRQITRAGSVQKLTSQFPSTTAAHITTIHTGMPVGEHGIFEWYYYEPVLDTVIAPLLHSFAGTSQRDTLKPAGAKPARLYPTDHSLPPAQETGCPGHNFPAPGIHPIHLWGPSFSRGKGHRLQDPARSAGQPGRAIVAGPGLRLISSCISTGSTPSATNTVPNLPQMTAEILDLPDDDGKHLPEGTAPATAGRSCSC